jgi:hypothetical protein
LILDQTPRISSLASPRRSSHSMHILAHISRDVVADDVQDVGEIDTSRNEIRANEPAQIQESAWHLLYQFQWTYIWISPFLKLARILVRSFGGSSLE